MAEVSLENVDLPFELLDLKLPQTGMESIDEPDEALMPRDGCETRQGVGCKAPRLAARLYADRPFMAPVGLRRRP